jgi:hypothetical protein
MVADEDELSSFEWCLPISVDHMRRAGSGAFVGGIGDRVFWGCDRKTFSLRREDAKET